MPAGSYDIHCISGEPLHVEIHVKNPDLSQADMLYWDPIMQVRPTTVSDTVIVELTSSNGRISRDLSSGTIVLDLSAEETSSLQSGGVFSIELHSTAGNTYRVVRVVQGLFTLG